MLLILSFKKNVIYTLSEDSAGHCLFFVPLLFIVFRIELMIFSKAYSFQKSVQKNHLSWQNSQNSSKTDFSN